jgi:hypothetical protein
VFLVLNVTFLFIRKKQKMKNKTEMFLFHAVGRIHMDYICKNNFEWILHGNREIRYGKGLCWRRENCDSSHAHGFLEMPLASLGRTASLDSSGLQRK